MIGLLALALAASTTAPQPLLQPLSNLAGHCWRGSAPANAGEDTHCFEWVYGGQHLRDRHVVTVKGKPVYEGETLYSVEGDAVTFTYWNSIGGVGRGRATANGDKLEFSGDIRTTPASPSEHFTANWHKVDGGYEVSDQGRTNSLFRRAD